MASRGRGRGGRGGGRGSGGRAYPWGRPVARVGQSGSTHAGGGGGSSSSNNDSNHFTHSSRSQQISSFFVSKAGATSSSSGSGSTGKNGSNSTFLRSSSSSSRGRNVNGSGRGGGRGSSSSSSRGRSGSGGGVRGFGKMKVTISLLKSCRELLVVNPFNSKVNDVLRKRGGRYDKECTPTPGWIVPLRMYKTVLEDLKALSAREGLDIRINGLPKWLLKAMHAPEWGTLQLLNQPLTAEKVHQAMQGRVPLRLLEQLLPYQLTGVLCAVKRRGRVLWCDEMGLGKTVQALVTALHYRSEWPLLIICPSSLKLTWAHEIKRWLELGEDAVQVVQNSKERLTHAVCILSYDLARALRSEVQQRQFRVVIADEAHYLKNRQAARTKALVPIIQRAKRALLLSGTPALSRPIELFQQLRALRRDLFSVEIAFGERYCNSHMTAFGWCHDGSSNEEELHALLQRTVMIRRDKKTVLASLPPKTRQTVLVDCSAKQRREIAKLMRKRTQLDAQRQSSRSAALERDLNGVTLRLFQLTGQGKLRACVAYVLEQASKGAKMLLFAHHQPVMDGMMQALCEKNIRHIRIDGSTPSHLRTELATRFQTDDTCRAALLSITAAGTGLTLHAATLVVFLELYWNPGQLLQAEDRAHRVGQRCVVDVKYMLCKDTQDESMWAKVEKKMAVVGRAVKGASETMEAQAMAVRAKRKKERGADGEDMVDDGDDDEGAGALEEGQMGIRSFFLQREETTASGGQTERAQQQQRHMGKKNSEEVDVVDLLEDDQGKAEERGEARCGERGEGRGGLTIAAEAGVERQHMGADGFEEGGRGSGGFLMCEDPMGHEEQRQKAEEEEEEDDDAKEYAAIAALLAAEDEEQGGGDEACPTVERSRHRELGEVNGDAGISPAKPTRSIGAAGSSGAGQTGAAAATAATGAAAAAAAKRRQGPCVARQGQASKRSKFQLGSSKGGQGKGMDSSGEGEQRRVREQVKEEEEEEEEKEEGEEGVEEEQDLDLDHDDDDDGDLSAILAAVEAAEEQAAAV